MSFLKPWSSLLKNYAVIEPYGLYKPMYTGEVDKWDNETAKRHYEWFLSVIPERIKNLEQAIQSNPPDVNFKADFTLSSLDKLSKWLNQNMTTVIPKEEQELRVKSLEERAKKRFENAKNLQDKKIAFLLDLAKKEAEHEIGKPTLSNESLSLIFDSGIYGGEMLIRANPDKLAWDYSKKAPKYIDHHKVTVRLPKQKGVGYHGINFIHIFHLDFETIEKGEVDLKRRFIYNVEAEAYLGIKLPV